MKRRPKAVGSEGGGGSGEEEEEKKLEKSGGRRRLKKQEGRERSKLRECLWEKGDKNPLHF